MPTKLETQISYLTAKRKYEKLLRERKILAEQRWEPGSGPAAELFKPFADVFKALKLTAMDIGNAARLVLGTLLTFDPGKIRKKREKFIDRRGLLRQEWLPIMEDSLRAIRTADPMLTFSLMPATYLAGQGLAAGVMTGANMAEILGGARWKYLIEKLWRMPDNKTALNAILDKLDQAGDGKTPAGKKSISDKLADLFFESKDPEGVLLEQKEGGPEYDTSSEEAWLRDFMADTELDKAFDDLAAEEAKNHLLVLQEIKPVVKKSEVVALLVAADTPDRFESTIKQAVSSGLLEDGDIAELKNVLPQIQDQTKKLAASDEFRQKLADTKKIKIEDLQDQDVTDAAKSTAFNAGKMSFNQKAMNGGDGSPGLQEFMTEIKSVLDEQKLDNDLLGQLRKRTDIPAVKELLDVYEITLQSYDKTQQAVAAVKGAKTK